MQVFWAGCMSLTIATRPLAAGVPGSAKGVRWQPQRHGTPGAFPGQAVEEPEWQDAGIPNHSPVAACCMHRAPWAGSGQKGVATSPASPPAPPVTHAHSSLLSSQHTSVSLAVGEALLSMYSQTTMSTDVL